MTLRVVYSKFLEWSERVVKGVERNLCCFRVVKSLMNFLQREDCPYLFIFSRGGSKPLLLKMSLSWKLTYLSTVRTSPFYFNPLCFNLLSKPTLLPFFRALIFQSPFYFNPLCFNLLSKPTLLPLFRALLLKSTLSKAIGPGANYNGLTLCSLLYKSI